MKYLFIYLNSILDTSLARSGNEMSASCGHGSLCAGLLEEALKGYHDSSLCSVMSQCHLEGVNVRAEVISVTPKIKTCAMKRPKESLYH